MAKLESESKSGYRINKKLYYAARYPSGTKLRLTEPIEDKYSPKDVGAIFVSDGIVDDALQLHGHWEDGGCIAIILEHDKYEIVNE